MTDITELAQREKFEAWFKSSFHPDKTGPYIKDQLYFAWKAASAELVEALEKAQQTEKTLKSRNCRLEGIITAAENRIAALENDLAAEEERRSNWIKMAEEFGGKLDAAEERIRDLETRTVTAAAADVLAERQRQVTAEGWSSKHDDQYKNTELAFAASCYAFHAAAASWDLEDDGIPYDSHPVPKQWPWDPSWWKPTNARRDLVKAGALILAEIERIDRAAGIKWEAE
ncbi:hypothetical protein N7615_03095 [Klebsiella grimontii]|uniref:hypothetical protein n=1 Tax=Klebsiella grimontii TaxID=2058152 RepID=UPI00244B0D58|nr:hypothetical protein [Klebsiella grimontii]MDG9896309.1 hypothetical protein [Klebsiella grimontii]